MATQAAPARGAEGIGKTERKDDWWIEPLLTALVLGGFIVYSTFRAFYNAEYVVHREGTNGWGELLSPFYSPLIILPGMKNVWWISPAFFILWAPAGFRLTCYYYRKAYYRTFFFDPPGCAVSEARGNRYMGETGLLIFQNLHRFFLYVALIFIVILTVDAVRACVFPVAEGEGLRFGMSVGSLVLIANATLLGLYTFSCHSLRHLVGGNLDCFSCTLGQTRYKLWKGASFLNKNHMKFAWISLFGVGFADFYVWMVASGRIPDIPFF